MSQPWAQGGNGCGVGADGDAMFTLQSSTVHGVAHALRGGGFDASEDGTGGGTPLVPVTVGALSCNTGPNGNDAGNFACNQAVDAGYVVPTFLHLNKGRPDGRKSAHTEMVTLETETIPTLTTDGHAQSCIAFSAKDYGGDAMQDCSPTLRAGGHDGSHANAGVMPAIAFQERGRDDGRSLEVGGEVAYALTAPKDGGRAQERNVLTPTMRVRRLTPRECERLQGFKDGYLDVAYRSKDAADGPKYKALGNSWAINCPRWIGERIKAVDAIKEAA